MNSVNETMSGTVVLDSGKLTPLQLTTEVTAQIETAGRKSNPKGDACPGPCGTRVSTPGIDSNGRSFAKLFVDFWRRLGASWVRAAEIQRRIDEDRLRDEFRYGRFRGPWM